jgi:hypothetical protein
MPKITSIFSRIWSEIAEDVFRRRIVDSGKKVYEINEGLKLVPFDSRSCKVEMRPVRSLSTDGVEAGVKSEFPSNGTQRLLSYRTHQDAPRKRFGGPTLVNIA